MTNERTITITLTNEEAEAAKLVLLKSYQEIIQQAERLKRQADFEKQEYGKQSQATENLRNRRFKKLDAICKILAEIDKGGKDNV